MLASPRVSSAAEEAHRNNLLQTFGSSAPRTSVSSQWGHDHNRTAIETAPQSYGPHGYATSSSLSAFSHPSSLYQGTPANGITLGMPTGVGYMDTSRYDRNHVQDPAPSSSGRRFQMDETTSSYDAAILQAAFYGNK
jgi:hypothetical protein